MAGPTHHSSHHSKGSGRHGKDGDGPRKPKSSKVSKPSKQRLCSQCGDNLPQGRRGYCKGCTESLANATTTGEGDESAQPDAQSNESTVPVQEYEVLMDGYGNILGWQDPSQGANIPNRDDMGNHLDPPRPYNPEGVPNTVSVDEARSLGYEHTTSQDLDHHAGGTHVDVESSWPGYKGFVDAERASLDENLFDDL